VTVHLPSTRTLVAALRQPTPARLPCGTRWIPFTVASFQTWRGSQPNAAQDQAINVTFRRPARTASGLGEEFDPA